MPRFGRHGGVLFYMYYEETRKGHHAPHFHALYQGQSVSIAIPSLKVFDGKIDPARQTDVMRWARKRKGALMKNWRLAQEGKPLNWID